MGSKSSLSLSCIKQPSNVLKTQHYTQRRFRIAFSGIKESVFCRLRTSIRFIPAFTLRCRKGSFSKAQREVDSNMGQSSSRQSRHKNSDVEERLLDPFNSLADTADQDPTESAGEKAPTSAVEKSHSSFGRLLTLGSQLCIWIGGAFAKFYLILLYILSLSSKAGVVYVIPRYDCSSGQQHHYPRAAILLWADCAGVFQKRRRRWHQQWRCHGGSQPIRRYPHVCTRHRRSSHHDPRMAIYPRG